MRTVTLVMAALLLPAAAALPAFVETWEGSADVRVFLASGTTVCRGAGDATLAVEREMEAATFVVAVVAPCEPLHVLRGVLSENGWRFVGVGNLVTGSFRPTAEPGVWHLVAHVSTCPPNVICEFSHGMRIYGDFRDPHVVL